MGLTRLDFVNTLPCAVKFEYASQTRGDVILNPAGFESLQGVNASKPYDIEAELILGSDGTCGGVNVTNSKWNGQVHGSSQKVRVNHSTETDLTDWLSLTGIYGYRFGTRWRAHLQANGSRNDFAEIQLWASASRVMLVTEMD